MCEEVFLIFISNFDSVIWQRGNHGRMEQFGLDMAQIASEFPRVSIPKNSLKPRQFSEAQPLQPLRLHLPSTEPAPFPAICPTQRIILISSMESHSKPSKTCHSMMHSYHPTSHKTDFCPMTVRLAVPFHRIQEQMELYEWRGRNSQQVVGCQWVKVQPFDDRNVVFTLRADKKLTSLEEVKSVKGSNILKNLAKVFTSFSLLYQKFGPFEVHPKMIAFDAFFQPYVWMNEDYSKNEYKRDLITEQEFASNILFAILKHDHKFQNSQILDYCCEIKGQGYTLKEVARFFLDFHEKDLQAKRSKITKCTSQESTLSFSKQSKIKKPLRTNKDFMGLNAINNQTFRSYLKSNQKPPRPTFQRTSSLKQIIGQAITTHEYPNIQGSDIKINILRQSQCEFLQKRVRESFLPIHQELQVSIDFSNQEEAEKQQTVIELQQLDKFKKFLAKSIITGPFK